MRTAHANGITTSYDDAGAGQPLVLLHGTTADRNQFTSFVPCLGDGIRAIAYDQRDSGGTHNDRSPYSMNVLADDCAALIRAVGLRCTHLLGTSFGGAIAMLVAIHHPEMVSSLTLVAATPSWQLVGPAGSVIASTPDPDERERLMLKMLISASAAESRPDLVSEVRAAISHRSPEQTRRRILALQQYDCLSDLPHITAPTLVINGTDDRLISPRTGELLAQQIPNAKLCLVTGARHGLTFEYREKVAAMVRRFVFSGRGATPDQG